MDIGTITEIKKTDDGLECRVDMGAGMVETAYLYGDGGHFEYPMIDDEVAVQMASDETSDSGAENVIICVFRNTPDGLGTGETILYSRDGDGAVASSVKCNGAGDVILNSGTRSAVGFAELKTGFDTLRIDFNTFISVYNAAQLPVNITTLIAGPPTVPGVPSVASIDASESDTVLVP